jgi:hypothetical protein
LAAFELVLVPLALASFVESALHQNVALLVAACQPPEKLMVKWASERAKEQRPEPLDSIDATRLKVHESLAPPGSEVS